MSPTLAPWEEAQQAAPSDSTPPWEEAAKAAPAQRPPQNPSSDFMAVPNPKGLVEPGNLPIWNRPTVQNADGTHSSEYSTSFQDEKGREVLVPTVVNGKFLTPDGAKPPEGSAAEKAMFRAAWQNYLKTGQHLGAFDSPDNADAYAQQLHTRDQRARITTAPSAQLPTGNLQAAPQPGILDRARASVANSLVGRAFGMEPTETEEEQQRTGDRTQLPQLPDWANKPLPAPGATTPIQKATEQQIGQFRAQHPIIGGVEKGVETTAEGLRSPANLALLAAAPESRIISAFFASQAAKGAYDSAEQAYQAFRQGKNAEAAQYATEAGLSGIVGALAGRHALKGAFPVDTGRPSVTEPTQVPREPARLGAGPQPEYQGEPQAPPQPAGIPDAEVAPWEEAARAQLTAKAGPTNDRTTPPPVNPDTARTRVAPTQFAQPAAVPDRGVLVDQQGNALVSRPGLPPPVETAGRKTPIIPSPAKPAPPVQTAPTPPPQMGSQAAMVRPTVQASTAPEAVRQSAEGQQPQLEGIVKQVAAGVPGAELEGSRVKTADSIANKEDRGKPVETTTDVLGARVSAPAEAQPQLEAKIEQQLPVVSKDKIDSNGLEATQYGVKTGKPGEPNQVSELQVVTPEQATAMKATDDLYDQQKKALAAGDKAKADEIGEENRGRV